MDNRIFFVFCALTFPITSTIAAAAHKEAKSYRSDYMYDWRTDAFYKLHLDSHSTLQRKQVCELEGAELMTPTSEQQSLGAAINQSQPLNEENDDWQQHDAALINNNIDSTESEEVLDLSCRVRTQKGYLSNIFPGSLFFICKVEAKDVHYDPICKVHSKGYQYIHSVSSCYKIPRVAYTWHQAAAECQAEGAHLAVINSAQEARELQSLTYSTRNVPESRDMPYFHIGFRAVKLTRPRVFKTIFNQTLEEAGFSTWARGEPTNTDGNEECGSIFRNQGKLNDIKCFERFAFICEKEIIKDPITEAPHLLLKTTA